LQVTQWSTEIEQLTQRLIELTDKLEEANVPITQWYTDTVFRAKVDSISKNPQEMRLKAENDKYLNQIRPVRRQSATSNVSEDVAMGASGFVSHFSEAEELATVHVLEDADHVVLDQRIVDAKQCSDADISRSIREKNIIDKKRVFEDADDELGRTTPKRSTDTGAVWRDGFRYSAELLAVLQTHQTEAMHFLVSNLNSNSGSLIAHAPGLGKTLTTLCALEVYSQPNPSTCVLLTCPKSMLHSWANEIIKWNDFIDLDAIVVTEKHDDSKFTLTCKRWKRGRSVMIIGHDRLRKLISMGIDTIIDHNTIVIVDEAHLLKEPSTQLYAAIASIPTQRRVFLTGTPLQNKLDEYYAMVNLLSPTLLGKTLHDFKTKFGDIIMDGMHSDSTQEQIQMSETRTQTLRLLVADVMHDKSANLLKGFIPPKYEYRINHAMIADSTGSYANPLAEAHAINDIARPDKVELFCRLVSAIRTCEPTDAIVVFSYRVATLLECTKVVPGHLYSGKTSDDHRQKMIDDFQSNGGIMYITTTSGGLGITLTTHWNPVNDNQAIARCWRMGQSKPTFVYRLVAQGTLEECIYHRGQQKYAIAERVIEDMDAPRLYTQSELVWGDDALFNFSNCSNDEVLKLSDISVSDPVLVPVLINCQKAGKPVSIYKHEASFLEQEVQVASESQLVVLNDFYKMKILTEHPRILQTLDGTSLHIPIADLYFPPPYNDQLVPAFTPSHDIVSDADGSKSILLHNCGPSNTFQLQIKTWQQGQQEEDVPWNKPLPPHSVQGTDVATCIHLKNLPMGCSIFRNRIVLEDSDDVTFGPWSQPSAPLTLSMNSLESF
jgi:superfamily II DNA or RNA helicase